MLMGHEFRKDLPYLLAISFCLKYHVYKTFEISFSKEWRRGGYFHNVVLDVCLPKQVQFFPLTKRYRIDEKSPRQKRPNGSCSTWGGFGQMRTLRYDWLIHPMRQPRRFIWSNYSDLTRQKVAKEGKSPYFRQIYVREILYFGQIHEY